MFLSSELSVVCVDYKCPSRGVSKLKSQTATISTSCCTRCFIHEEAVFCSRCQCSVLIKRFGSVSVFLLLHCIDPVGEERTHGGRWVRARVHSSPVIIDDRQLSE